jgi:methyltransferase-like protein 6
MTVFACDCSKDTLQKASEIISNTKGIDVKDRLWTFLLDVSKETFPDWLFCKACQSSHGKAAEKLLGYTFCFSNSIILVFYCSYLVSNSS